MPKIGTAHIELKPVLNEEALEQIAARIEAAVKAGVEAGMAAARPAVGPHITTDGWEIAARDAREFMERLQAHRPRGDDS